MFIRRLGLLLWIVATSYSIATAQNTTIIGKVSDSVSNLSLHNASIVLLQAKDSFIVSDVRADKEGRFTFSHLSDTAKYVLFFSYPKYANYSYVADMKNAVNGVWDMKRVNLWQTAKLLQEVIVQSKLSAIKIKGDTTEYAADSFKVQANATVEDLLKQLPGLQVDQYGNITAQGQKVKKVLVDGEEFFSTDPTLVTRNLRADMIDKVQVYDKKSDAAAFTGIEDGVKDKTINLKIKEDKNHGMFGKADAGAGTDKRYSAQGMINFFKGKRKMSAYGTTGNTGRTGLGAADKEKIGSDEDGNGNYNGKGLPIVHSGGLHYDKKWNADKELINGNYKLNITRITGDENTISQNNLPTGIIQSNANSHFDNTDTKHDVNAKYEHTFDTTSTIRLYTNAAVYNSKNHNQSKTESKRGNGSLLNDNRSFASNSYDVNSYNLNLSWEKKLKKYGRTISFYFNNNFSNDASMGESRSQSGFYNTNSVLDSTALLHLQKRMKDDWRTHSFTAYYTEPLTKKLSLIINYSFTNEVVHDDKRSYNIAKNPLATVIDTAFSSKINAGTLSHQGGAALNYAYKKIIAKLGNNIKSVSMDIENIFQPLQVSKQFVNWNPQANFQYKFSMYKNFSFNYDGNTNNPERNQLLPLNYNNSQLTTYLPNLGLKNSFTNNFSTEYFTYKVLSQTYAGARFMYTTVSNPVVAGISVDANGAYTYQFVNMNGYTNNNYFASVAYSKKIQKWDVQATAFTNVSGGRFYSIINNAVNQLNNNTYSLTINLYRSKVKKHEILLSGTGGYTTNKSSLQPDIKNNYFFYTLNPSVDIYFLKKFQMHTDANYFWQQKTQTFAKNFDRLIWNAWLGRSFFKNDQLMVKISCNDILNQNNGYARSASNTFFTENRYSTIRRFFMIGATWNFTKFNNIKQ